VIDDSLCSCGDCGACRRKAAERVAGYVAKKRYQQRRSYNRSDPKERDYVHRQVKLLLAMTGLGSEDLMDTDELLRSEWGKAMRSRQSSR
jgi:hypothetical protein